MKYISFNEIEKYGYIAKQTTLSAGDMKDEQNLKNVLISLNLDKTLCAKAKQTHSANILCIEKNTNLDNLENIDGFITDRNITLITYYADCLPIFILDTRTNVYGLIHSGWRGSVQKILVKAIDIFKDKYKSNIDDILVCLGVGISAENYEIKEDTVKIITSLLNFDNMLTYKDDKIYLSNSLLNKELALRVGIKEENIVLNNYCSFRDNFHSYRRDRNDERMVAIFYKKGV